MDQESLYIVATLEVAVRRARNTAGRYCSVIELVHHEYLQGMFDSQAAWHETSGRHLRRPRNGQKRSRSSAAVGLRPARQR